MKPTARSDSPRRRTNGADDGDPESWPLAKVEIYDAAVELFWRQGFEETSVQQIVDKAGLTKGALYHYFESKDELLRVATERGLDHFLPAARDIAARQLPFPEALELIIRNMLEGIVLFQREMGLFFAQWRHRGDVLPATQNKRKDYESAMQVIVERALANGEIRSVASAQLITFAIFGMCTHPQTWWRPNRPLTVDDLTHVFTEILLEGLTPRATP